MLANPNLISQAVLKNSLDSQTAFEIVSIDVAEIDVGDNIGANLQADQAAADLRVAQAQAEKRRAAGRRPGAGNEGRRRGEPRQGRAGRGRGAAGASPTPSATGNLGVMDYYNLRNLQSDTEMRNAIAGTGTGTASGTASATNAARNDRARCRRRRNPISAPMGCADIA